MENIFNTISKSERKSNIELLRIILMFMIILFHMLAHGGKIHKLSNGSFYTTDNTPIFLFVFSFLSFAVNCFVFISGYYGIKVRLKTILSLIFQGVFYGTSPNVPALSHEKICSCNSALLPIHVFFVAGKPKE